MNRCTQGRACALAAALLASSACGGDSTAPALAPATSATAVPSAPDATPTTPTAVATTTTTEAVRLIEVTYAGGQVAGGAQRTTVRLGETVRIRVESDVADEVHVHTYDVRSPVAPGRPAELELVATIPGRHEVELEKKGKQLLVLEVR